MGKAVQVLLGEEPSDEAKARIYSPHKCDELLSIERKLSLESIIPGKGVIDIMPWFDAEDKKAYNLSISFKLEEIPYLISLNINYCPFCGVNLSI